MRKSRKLERLKNLREFSDGLKDTTSLKEMSQIVTQEVARFGDSQSI